MLSGTSKTKELLTSPDRLSFVLKVPLRYLRPSIIYSVLCDWILQRAYFVEKSGTTYFPEYYPIFALLSVERSLWGGKRENIFQTFSSKSGRFDLTFGILENWSLRRDDHNRRFDCSSFLRADKNRNCQGKGKVFNLWLSFKQTARHQLYDS